MLQPSSHDLDALLNHGDRDERDLQGPARLHLTEQDHQEREGHFGGAVAVIDPEPPAAISDRHEGVVRFLLAGLHSNEGRSLAFPLADFR